MNVKFKAFIAFFVIGLVLTFWWRTSQQTTQTLVTLNSADQKTQKELNDTNRGAISRSSLSRITVQPSGTTNGDQETVQEATRESLLVFDGNKISNSEELYQAFFDSSGRVKRSALNDFFVEQDVHAFIEMMQSFDETQTSSEREVLLSQELTSLDLPINAEELRCRSGLCVLTFNYTQLNQEQVSEIASFDSNYAFTVQVSPSSVEKRFKGIYLKTDDPTKLTLSNRPD
ncbi:hypothetical protein [Paraferrimonas haliotis]|uniref:hypothetical protein n=1 Tax=Paraferrimonas haliotis TaxID=2013866 RepID=UPI000BA928ED|nr:hypothetical protein [Paraferrimonas haliotis]